MSVNREELKRLIDLIDEEAATEVYDFIDYLNMKREKEAVGKMDMKGLAQDLELIRQIEESRKDRANGRVYGREQGLNYLRANTRATENE